MLPTDDLIVSGARVRAASLHSRLRALMAAPQPPAIAACAEFGGCLAVRKPAFARLLAAGPDLPPALDEAIAWLEQIGTGEVTFEVPPIDANLPVREALARRGFFPRRLQALLACEARTLDPASPADVEIRAPRADEMADYMRTFSEGFRELSPPSAGDPSERQREMIHEFSDPQHWRLLLAAIAGEQAGIGTLFVAGTTAFFGNGATVPRFRGRGVHGALIRARLRDAFLAGAAIVYVDTSVSSAAERNLHRHGFRLVGHLEMWSRLPERPAGPATA